MPSLMNLVEGYGAEILQRIIVIFYMLSSTEDVSMEHS